MWFQPSPNFLSSRDVKRAVDQRFSHLNADRRGDIAYALLRYGNKVILSTCEDRIRKLPNGAARAKCLFTERELAMVDLVQAAGREEMFRVVDVVQSIIDKKAAAGDRVIIGAAVTGFAAAFTAQKLGTSLHIVRVVFNSCWAGLGSVLVVYPFTFRPEYRVKDFLYELKHDLNSVELKTSFNSLSDVFEQGLAGFREVLQAALATRRAEVSKEFEILRLLS